MTPKYSIVAGAVVLWMSAGGALAQTTTPFVLNSLEVQQLIRRGEPMDHARLGAHFATLADSYAADAERHNAMAQSFIASPIRRTAANSAADHCKRLEQLNRQSAATLRELAAHHDALAAGETSTAPREGARFESGAGAPAPTAQQLSALAANAATSADHRSLQEYFEAVARRYKAESNDHAAMAQAYRETRTAQSAAHYDRLAKLSRESAKEATAAAELHKNLADAGR